MSLGLNSDHTSVYIPRTAIKQGVLSVISELDRASASPDAAAKCSQCWLQESILLLHRSTCKLYYLVVLSVNL